MGKPVKREPKKAVLETYVDRLWDGAGTHAKRWISWQPRWRREIHAADGCVAKTLDN